MGEDAEDTALLRETVGLAHRYLLGWDWCGEIRECYLGDVSLGGIVAVLLFRIEPASEGVDDWLWVVVGDVPPAYLVLDVSPNPAAALDGYIVEMERWITAVRGGEPVDELMPVRTRDGHELLRPSRELADEIDTRLRYLRDEILPYYADDLEAGQSSK